MNKNDTQKFNLNNLDFDIIKKRINKMNMKQQVYGNSVYHRPFNTYKINNNIDIIDCDKCFVVRDKNKYIAYFKNGVSHIVESCTVLSGKGSYKYDNGDLYNGNFINGLANGKGIYI